MKFTFKLTPQEYKQINTLFFVEHNSIRRYLHARTLGWFTYNGYIFPAFETGKVYIVRYPQTHMIHFVKNGFTSLKILSMYSDVYAHPDIHIQLPISLYSWRRNGFRNLTGNVELAFLGDYAITFVDPVFSMFTDQVYVLTQGILLGTNSKKTVKMKIKSTDYHNTYLYNLIHETSEVQKDVVIPNYAWRAMYTQLRRSVSEKYLLSVMYNKHVHRKVYLTFNQSILSISIPCLRFQEQVYLTTAFNGRIVLDIFDYVDILNTFNQVNQNVTVQITHIPFLEERMIRFSVSRLTILALEPKEIDYSSSLFRTLKRYKQKLKQMLEGMM